MQTALEQLGLSGEFDEDEEATTSGALGKLGLTPQDIGSPVPAGPPSGVDRLASTHTPEGQLGTLASGALGTAQGLTFGLSDEMAGVLHGAMQSLPGGQGFKSGYREGTDYVRDLHDRAKPGAMLAGDIAGSLVLPGGAVRAGGTLAAKAGRAAMTGAVQGGIGGAGRAEGGAADRASGAVSGAAIGGAVGGVVGAALPGATRATQKFLARNSDEAGAGALSAIRDAARAGKQNVNEAYDAIALLDGKIEGEAAFGMLKSKLNRVLDEGGFAYTPGVGDDATKVADRLLKDLGEGASIQQLEGARKGLNRALGNLRADPARAAAVNAIKGEFDDWMVDTISNGLYRGDDEVLGTLKTARGLNTEYQRLFGVGGNTTQDRAAGRIIDQIIKDDTGPGEAVNLIFGMSGAGVKASRQAVARIRDISPEALEQMKFAHFQKILAPNGGEFDSGLKIAQRIQKLNANQNQMMKTLYGEDLGALNALGDQLKSQTSGVPDRVKNFIVSRPSLAAAGALAFGATSENPFIGAIVGGLAGGKRGGGGPANLALAGRKAGVPAASKVANRAARLGGISPSLENK